MDFFRAQFTKIPQLKLTNLSKATVLITGANTGIGLETARELLKHKPQRMILAVRNLEKGGKAKSELEPLKAHGTSIEVQQLDYGSFESIRKFASGLSGQRIDVAILNAGVFNAKWQTTSDGYESDLQINVLAPALLSLLLLPNLRAASASAEKSIQPHLSIVSSGLHEMAKFPERSKPAGTILTSLNDSKEYKQQDRYPTTKVISLLWVKELARRIPGSEIVINAPNPGFCNTGLMGQMSGVMKYVVHLFTVLFGRSPDAGARCIADAAIIKGPESHGQFVTETLVKPGSPMVQGDKADALQKALWTEVVAHLERAGCEVTEP